MFYCAELCPYCSYWPGEESNYPSMRPAQSSTVRHSALCCVRYDARSEVVSWQVDHITSLRRYADCQLPAVSGLRIITAETKMVMSRPGAVVSAWYPLTQHHNNNSIRSGFCGVQMRSYVLYHVWYGAWVRIQSTNNQINKTKCMHVNQICKCLDTGRYTAACSNNNGPGSRKVWAAACPPPLLGTLAICEQQNTQHIGN